ncbi:MAG: DNA mismatch repair protein MutS [Bacteroidota bacterium]
MKQYNAIKTKHPDALLLFRVGDFYETFGADAVTAAGILHITLTKRGAGSASEIELAGFPHHSLQTYLPKLVRAGARVAICDQLEDPKTAVGIVKRGVTELVTPGILMSDNVLDSSRNNWLAAVHYPMSGPLGLALLDASTGEFFCAEGDVDSIDKLLQNYSPAELLYCRQRRQAFLNTFGEGWNAYTPDEWVFTREFGHDRLCRQFETKTLKGFGVEDMEAAICAAGAILHYLNETEHRELGHIRSISRLEHEQYVWMDRFTIRNLELLFPAQEGGVPLISVLDKTCTPMGARLLRQNLLLPLKDKAAIDARLDAVESLLADPDLATELRNLLKTMGDPERLIAKTAARRVNPRELNRLKDALAAMGPLKQMLSASPFAQLQQMAKEIDPCAPLLARLSEFLADDPPLQTNAGGMIRDGVHAELDELRNLNANSRDFLQQIQNRESERTGISSLKVAYNRVFGFYLEVTNVHKDKAPADWIRKQTLANAERYITPELKEYEDKITNAEASIATIEFRLYNDLVSYALEFVPAIQQNARTIAALDCRLGFARLAELNNYCKPVTANDTRLNIVAGRHPVIEKQLPSGETYVPNDTLLDSDDAQVLIITGPNMAGKSALLRQTALIVLMTQIGSYVPAESAEVGLADKIFTRVGAGDNISRGESTFMVEMTETAGILNNLGPASLVLMDEIGRGTGTFDGVSIAWSIVEFLHNHKGRPRTLFATHYHELNELAERLPRIRNFNVSVREANNKVIFMRKLSPGGSRHSFGIHVAQMAGMPNTVVLRASEVLLHLENDRPSMETEQKMKAVPAPALQLSFFDSANKQTAEVEEMLRAIDINNISPVEALMKLNEIKNRLLPDKAVGKKAKR